MRMLLVAIHILYVYTVVTCDLLSLKKLFLTDQSLLLSFVGKN